MSSKARQQRPVGEIVNLMSIDAQRLQDVVTWMYSIYTAPVQISLALGLLYQFLGPSIFAGFGMMVLLIPLNVIASGKGKKYQVRRRRGGEGRGGKGRVDGGWVGGWVSGWMDGTQICKGDPSPFLPSTGGADDPERLPHQATE